VFKHDNTPLVEVSFPDSHVIQTL